MSDEEREPPRRRRRARRPDPATNNPPEEPASDADETFVLRTRGALGPVLLLLVGVVMSLLFGLTAIAAPTTPGLFLAGFGLMLTGVAWALLFGRQSILEISVGPAGATLLGSDRSSVTIPRGALTDARAHRVTQTTTDSTSSGATRSSVHHVVRLHKRDGGLIDLGRRRDEAEAERLAQEITAALQRFEATADAPSDPLAILRESTLVRAHRDEVAGGADYRRAARDGALDVEWSLRPSHATVVPSVVAPLGFACALYGFHLQQHASLLLALSVLFAVIVPLMLARHVYDLGRSQGLRVHEDSLCIEKRRGGHRLQEHRIPLESVTAVDYSHMQDMVGGVLAVRIDGAKSPSWQRPPHRQGLSR